MTEVMTCREGLLILQDGPVQPGAHWHSNPWLDSTQLPPFKQGSDRQALSATESQRERCYNVVLTHTHNQSTTETEQCFLKECTKYRHSTPKIKHMDHTFAKQWQTLLLFKPLPVSCHLMAARPLSTHVTESFKLKSIFHCSIYLIS